MNTSEFSREEKDIGYAKRMITMRHATALSIAHMCELHRIVKSNVISIEMPNILVYTRLTCEKKDAEIFTIGCGSEKRLMCLTQCVMPD